MNPILWTSSLIKIIQVICSFWSLHKTGDRPFYAEHIHSDSSSVYSLFVRENIFDLLVNDYEDLHGMYYKAILRLQSAIAPEYKHPIPPHIIRMHIATLIIHRETNEVIHGF